VRRQELLKLITIAGVVVVVIALLMGGCAKPAPAPSPTPAPAEEPVEPIILTISHHMKPDATSSTVISNWADLVTERTDGRVKFDIFPQSQLFMGKQAGKLVPRAKLICR